MCSSLIDAMNAGGRVITTRRSLQFAFIKEKSTGVAQSLVKHRGPGVDDTQHEESRGQLMKVRLHNVAELNASSFISGTAFLFKSKAALHSGCVG